MDERRKETIMAVTRGVGSMNESEVKEMLDTSKVGILCLEDDDKPYGVPLEHYFDGKNLYFAASLKHGYRKFGCIKSNPNASYIVYDSRRENSELVSKGIRCRSLILEGRASLAAVKELDDKEMGRVKLQMIKLEVETIGNWKCPRKECHWHEQWFKRHPELVSDL
jgi:nitroimidazol reductase NimA-like FMN-containing flavoprotein (pyridoxamine 5'-phosphate oxidase superfamily)